MLTEALQADYWKPIQAGTAEQTDRETIGQLISNSHSVLHPETYLLKEPASPHYAAFKEGIEIEIENLHMPQTANRLLIEGAGGLLVPISPELVMFDLIEYFKLPVIVVVRNYLGSVNHTLLTLQFLETQGVNVLGVIYSGTNYNDNEQIIEHLSGVTVLGRVQETDTVNKAFVAQQALAMRHSLQQWFTL